jgi:DNA polymerase III, delta subunit
MSTLAFRKTADLSIKKPLAPVFLLYGSQDYLIRLMKKNIIREALPEEERDFNLSRYDMFEAPLQEALEDAATVPFMGSKKVVLIENPFFLTAEKVKAKLDHHLPSLKSYLDNPSPDTVLILAAPYEKLDRRKSIVKMLEKKAKVYELSYLSDSTLYGLMETIALKYGSAYTRSGHEQLVASAGQDLARLAEEVGKCALYCGTERPIDREAVLEIGSRSLETNVFLLVNNVMKGRTVDALHLLHELVEMKEEPLKLLALLERQFRIVYQVAAYRDAGYTQNSIATKIGVHPYAVKMAAEQAGRYSAVAIEQVLATCAETDYQIKTGRTDKLLGLELLIRKISSAA